MSKKPPIVMVPPPTPDWDCELEPVPPDVGAAWLFEAVSPDTWPDGLNPLRPPCWKAGTVITPSPEATIKEPAMRGTRTPPQKFRATPGTSDSASLGFLI